MSTMLNGHKRISVTMSAKRMPLRYSEPAPFEKLNWLIHLLHVRGDTRACRELIEDEIGNTGGRNEFLHYKKGCLFKNEGKTSEALEAFQTCLRINPENPDNMMEVGGCLYELKRYKLALDAYKEAERISITPDWQIFHKIAEILLLKEDTEGAKAYVRKAVEHGRNEISYKLLVKILKEEKDFKSALAVCRSGIEFCPDSVDMMCEVGFLHLRLGETQHAFERFSDALAFNPQCSKALLGIGFVTQSHGEIDVALTKYKAAIQFQPNSVALWNNIGICFHSLQKHIASMSCLKRALWMDPLNWKILFNLGLVHLSMHQQASAFNYLCAAVNLRPDAAGVFNALGCMSRNRELVSNIGLRVDGRRPGELRRIRCKLGVFPEPDGSAYIEQGLTKVLAAVYGPHQVRGGRSKAKHNEAVINCQFSMAVFSTGERKRRPRGDAKSTEMSINLRQALIAAIKIELYPWSQIDVYVEVLHADGGCLMELQDPENALRAFNQASILAPNDLISLLNATICLIRVGDMEKFHQNMQEIEIFMNTHPNVAKESSELYNQLAGVSLEARDLAENQSSRKKPDTIKREVKISKAEKVEEMGSDEV